MEFLKSQTRFRFTYGGTPFQQLHYEKSQTLNGNVLTTVYRFSEGLTVTNIATKYPEHGAYEWVNYFENTGDAPTPVLSEVWDCDCALPITHEDPAQFVSYLKDPDRQTRIFAPTGSVCGTKEFYTDPDLIIRQKRQNHIHPGETKSYSANDGWSSDKAAPYFNVHKDGMGYFFAIGWTGQWNCQIERTEDQLLFRSKIEDTHFRLLPGERLRTSSVVILPYHADIIGSHNLWRRLLRDHFSLIGQEGRDPHGPLCVNVWGGMRSESVLQRIKLLQEMDFPAEYLWMDAGWYGAETQPTPDEFEGDWPEHVGDWRVSPHTHPNGLKDVVQAVHDAGMKFLLWFEPERARSSVPAVAEHPEYFLSNGNPQDKNRFLNLGDPRAWDYCFSTISALIEELQIDCYRQDCNYDSPLEYWRHNDTEDRQGITEIKHINGLYRFWDALLERFPHLLIDNCAGGGRRLDIEMLRRSIPLWRSDFQCPANYDVVGSQCHNLNINAWMPYSGTGTGRLPDRYRFRSAFSPALSFGFGFSERDDTIEHADKMETTVRLAREYRKVRPYFSGDFYPLTQFSDREDTWCAAQFHRPEENDGIVQVFRRKDAPYERAVFPLRGVTPSCSYVFTDADDETEIHISGEALLSRGWEAILPERESAKLWFYKKA